MSSEVLKFRHEVIDPDPPGWRHDVTLIADLDGNGKNDIIIGGHDGEVTLFWYENPSWERHEMSGAPELEAGGVMVDITRNGRPDIVIGQQLPGNLLFWFENPQDPTGPWKHRVIENRFVKYHDQAVGDVDGDGELEIVFLSQENGILAYYDIPEDPHVEPWPEECFHLMAEGWGSDVEGLAIVDIDGDGQIEVVAGTHILRPGKSKKDKWQVEAYAQGPRFTKPRVVVADLDGDGRLDILIAEGESNPARLAICSPPDWEPTFLRDDLFHPHSLEVADFNGNGLPDIFVAEMGLGKNPDPKIFVFLNKGAGEFEEVLIESGVPTHESKVADLTGNGLPDIVGKPYDPEKHINVWFNETR